MHDRVFPVRYVGRYEARSWFQPRSFGLLLEWGSNRYGPIYRAHLGPFGITAEIWKDGGDE